MRALILAAGFGSRLLEHTTNIPKALVEMAGKPILEYQIEALLQNGIKSINIVIGYQGGKIIDHLKRKKQILVKDAASRDVFMSQKRALIHHKSTRARARMGKWLGYSLPSAANGVSRWNDYPATFISLFNLKWSESVRYRHLIFKIPKPVLFLYLFFFKLLTNF